jgi:hypothetical protein
MRAGDTTHKLRVILRKYPKNVTNRTAGLVAMENNGARGSLISKMPRKNVNLDHNTIHL